MRFLGPLVLASGLLVLVPACDGQSDPIEQGRLDQTGQAEGQPASLAPDEGEQQGILYQSEFEPAESTDSPAGSRYE
jgi:hypothetical protein